MKDNKILIGLLALSAAIIISSLLISYTILKQTDFQIQTAQNNEKALMTESEAAAYLNMSQEKMNNLLTDESIQRKKLNVYETYKFIPYIEIDGAYYFNKEQVNKWIEYNSANRTRIFTGVN